MFWVSSLIYSELLFDQPLISSSNTSSAFSDKCCLYRTDKGAINVSEWNGVSAFLTSFQLKGSRTALCSFLLGFQVTALCSACQTANSHDSFSFVTSFPFFSFSYKSVSSTIQHLCLSTVPVISHLPTQDGRLGRLGLFLLHCTRFCRQWNSYFMFSVKGCAVISDSHLKSIQTESVNET